MGHFSLSEIISVHTFHSMNKIILIVFLFGIVTSCKPKHKSERDWCGTSYCELDEKCSWRMETPGRMGPVVYEGCKKIQNGLECVPGLVCDRKTTRCVKEYLQKFKKNVAYCETRPRYRGRNISVKPVGGPSDSYGKKQF